MNKTIQYDYKNQAWVIDGVYSPCNHPAEMDCSCYGTEHAGETASFCLHQDQTYYYTDDMVGMYGVCKDCSATVREEA